MRFAYPLRGERPPQKRLCAALTAGAAVHGDKIIPTSDYKPDVDGCVLLGIGGLYQSVDNRTVAGTYKACGKRVILFDKGYVRRDLNRNDYLRVSIDSFQPLGYIHNNKRPPDRFERLGVKLKPYQLGDDSILFDGARQKYCDWFGLGDNVAWGKSIIDQIRQVSDAPIIYRPKRITPSHEMLGQIPNVTLSRATLAEDLQCTRLIVSHAGNMGWEALVNGIPHFALGPSIARQLSEIFWFRFTKPYVPTAYDRYQLMCNAAYCQWTLAELADGTAWKIIRQQLEETQR